MQQSVSDLKQTTMRNKIEANNLVWDFQNKQQHDLESIHKSLLDLNKSAAGNRIESDDLACDFQNRQQQDMELIKQSLLDLKQCVKSSKAESDVLYPLSSDDEREPMNHKRKRTNKGSRKRKTKVRDNTPSDWNAPM